ncbi:pyridoxamine 5'-phosphate oxidase family protein [Spirosoma foliorum]|uniref:Pyridoxamine 5'-phosphate oxidase family protein n=1 Tax=Spirosoma foliorum TaxID=2710596 RepID=A0A7G5H4L4_9BACT|nr:pyridoxamine 5'-phosphate oxidase family protein [Spirosoma foliorum]QMW06056.1 pyridoxamine 5'-phosphate oxidase family protein [Spirosoma foliorum]
MSIQSAAANHHPSQENSKAVAMLPDLERTSWEQLRAAAEQKDDQPEASGFKTMTVATCTSRGADARMVVLRRVDIDHKYVWFYSDARAEKVLQLEAFPQASLLFWDSNRHVQLRLTVETRLHTDDYVADDHWEKLGVAGRKAYLSEQKPGTEQPHPYPGVPDHLVNNLPSIEESEAGRKNFAVIECRVLAMEYLQLSRQGHTRACFQYEPESKMSWLAP